MIHMFLGDGNLSIYFIIFCKFIFILYILHIHDIPINNFISTKYLINKQNVQFIYFSLNLPRSVLDSGKNRKINIMF